MFLVNSRSHLVSSTPISLESKFHHHWGRTFFRSYGTNLPSSFTRVFSSALGFSPHPPVLVCGTVLYYLKLRGFSWKHGINHFPIQRSVVSYLDIKSPDLPKLSAYILSPGQPSPGRFSLLRPLIAVIQSTGMLTSFPSTTPFGLALGADSPCTD